MVDIYADLGDFETNPIGSCLKDTSISGSKELGDGDQEGETNSTKPKGTPHTPPPMT